MLLTQEFEPYIRHICNKFEVPQLADKIIQHAQPALRMHPVAMDNNTGNYSLSSRFGGKPALPVDMKWPELQNGFQLDFILQINLEEIRHMPQAKSLPNQGMIYLFADHREQEDNLDGSFQKVIYSPDTNPKLRDFPFEYDSQNSDLKIKENQIRFSEVMTIYDAESLMECCDVELDDIESEIYEENFDCATCDQALHLLFGVQTHQDDVGITKSNGEYIDEREALQLLFRIDWDEITNTTWVDGGKIYSYINPEDLAKHDFSKVCFSWMTC